MVLTVQPPLPVRTDWNIFDHVNVLTATEEDQAFCEDIMRLRIVVGAAFAAVMLTLVGGAVMALTDLPAPQDTEPLPGEPKSVADGVINVAAGHMAQRLEVDPAEISLVRIEDRYDGDRSNSSFDVWLAVSGYTYVYVTNSQNEVRLVEVRT